jgi:steroid Delta-isomerase
MSVETSDPTLARFVDFYRTYSAAWLERLPEMYAPDFEFRDPFGVIHADYHKLKSHFRKVITQVHESRFLVDDALRGGERAFVAWTWQWRWRAGNPQKNVPGTTQLRFGADERIIFHRDIFDAAEGFYEVMPVLGSVLRFARKRVSA